MGMGVLAVILLVGFASAAVTFNSVTPSQLLLTEGAQTFDISATSTDIESVVFSFNPITITDSNGKTITFAGLTHPFGGTSAEPITFDYDVQVGFNFEFYEDYKTNLTASTGGSQIVSFTKNTEFCTYDDNEYTDLNNDLNLEIRHIKVISGFGEDYEWLPFDEVELELKIDNKNNDQKIKDISIEWGIYDKKTGEWAIDVDEEKEIDLKDGEDETIIFTFIVDDDLDEDLEDLVNGDLVLYVRATGEFKEDNTNPEYDACASDSGIVTVYEESDFVILNNIDFTELVSCGTNLQITADVWNIGDNDQEDVYVMIYNTALGINERINIGDIDAFDREKFDVLIEIPEDAEEKYYPLTFEVYDEDNDIFENDYDEDESSFTLPLQIEGSCLGSSSSVSDVTISASLESGGKAGEEMIVRATVTNIGKESGTYTIMTTGYSNWASSASVDQSTFTLAKGDSKEILVTLNVKEDVEGNKLFDIEVLTAGEIVKTQSVSVFIEKEGFSLSNLLDGNNAWLWGIGLFNVVLVIIIIIVIVKIARK